nr:hypothetical protein [Anaerolineae bacterium]
MSQDLRLTLRKSRVMPENLIQSLWKQACLRQIRSDALSPLLRAIPVAVSLLALMIPMLSCQALSGGQPDRLSVIPSAAQEIEFVAIPIITADIENRTTTVPGAAVMPALVTATEPHPLFVANPTPLPQAPPACCPANDL